MSCRTHFQANTYSHIFPQAHHPICQQHLSGISNLRIYSLLQYLRHGPYYICISFSIWIFGSKLFVLKFQPFILLLFLKKANWHYCPLNYARLCTLSPIISFSPLNPLNFHKLAIDDGIVTSSIFLSWYIALSTPFYIYNCIKPEKYNNMA